MAQTERLKVNLVQGENRQQSVIRGQIEIPDAKPDLEQVLSKEVTTKVKETTVVPDKVIVNGVLAVQVMYVAFVPAQSVHTFEGDVPFTTFVDAPGAEPGADVYVDIRVEDINLTPSRKNPRRFDVSAVANVFVKVSEVEEMEILTETPPGNKALETRDITVEHMVGDKTTKQIIVSDTFEVPEEKPDVERVLKADATAGVTGTRLLANKVVVDGEVRLQVLYTAMEPEQSVHDLHHSIPFSNFLEVPDARPGMNVRVTAEVESVDVRPVVDPALSADVIVKLTAYVSETRTLENVPTRLQNETGYEKRKLKLDQQIGSAEKQVVLVSTQPVPEPKPLVTKIIESKVDQTNVVETKILDGKIVVRGSVEVKVVYVSDLPSQAVHAMHQTLNFSSFVEIPEAKPGMSVEVKVDAEYVNVEPKVDNVRLEVVLKVKSTVTTIMQTDVYVVSEITPPAPEPCPPVEYTVQSGDTLSKIAATHKTTVEMILAINPEIKDADSLSVGQKIMIPCPAMG